MEHKCRKILLLIETSREYGRGLLRGIFHYSKLYGPWQFELPESYNPQNTNSVKNIIRLLEKVDGVIMRDQPNNQLFLDFGIPIIFANHLKTYGSDICQITTDDEHISKCAVEYFREHGLVHFAYIGYDSMYWSENRKTSFCRAVEKLGYECNVFCQSKEKSMNIWSQEQAQVAEWIKSLPKPIGLLACDDDRAIQVLDACRMANKMVPGDVAVVGVDNDELICNGTHPPLSSVSLSLESAGFQAAQLLDAMISGAQKTPCRINVQASRVVARQSSEIFNITDDVALKAVRFIHTNSLKPISVADLEDHLAISRKLLYKKFRLGLGCPVYKYIKKVRVAQIEKLLLETDWKMERIANVMGFSSSDHIAAYFRSQTGINPNDYRSQKKLVCVLNQTTDSKLRDLYTNMR